MGGEERRRAFIGEGGEWGDQRRACGLENTLDGKAGSSVTGVQSGDPGRSIRVGWWEVGAVGKGEKTGCRGRGRR